MKRKKMMATSLELKYTQLLVDITGRKLESGVREFETGLRLAIFLNRIRDSKFKLIIISVTDTEFRKNQRCNSRYSKFSKMYKVNSQLIDTNYPSKKWYIFPPWIFYTSHLRLTCNNTIYYQKRIRHKPEMGKI